MGFSTGVETGAEAGVLDPAERSSQLVAPATTRRRRNASALFP
jgi:hypothetical protein